MSHSSGRWSKFQAQIESRFAECLCGRLRVRSVAYRKAHDHVGRAYFEFDGREIGNFCELSSMVHRGGNANPACHGTDVPLWFWTVPLDSTTPDAIQEPGEFSHNDFYTSCNAFLDMNIDMALASANPLILALAMIDRRLGKRRLERIRHAELPPIAATLLNLRLTAAGMSDDT